MISEKNEYMPPVMFHPGVILAEKLEEIKMPIKEFALRCQKPAKTIHDVLKGNSNITPDMSILFENVLKIPARFWMKLQGDYDEYLARQQNIPLIPGSGNQEFIRHILKDQRGIQNNSSSEAETCE